MPEINEERNENESVAVETRSKTTAMDNILKAVRPLMNFPKIGDLIEGRVIKKDSKSLYLDLGFWGTGIIYGREFIVARDIIKKLNIGETVFAKIVELENDDGFHELSLKEAGKEQAWQILKKKMEAGEVIIAKITEANRGGLMALVDGVEGFLPVSQLTPKHYPRVEKGDKQKIFEELQKFVGQEMAVKIIDLDRPSSKLIISEREVASPEFKAALSKYKVGDVISGEISGVVDFGAFVKFENEPLLEGLIHISELDFKLIDHPSNFVKVGETVKAQIINIEEDRISLSLRSLKRDPWLDINNKYKKGDLVKGEVTKFNPFGVFVQLDPDIQGLCHISEFGSEAKMREKLTQGGIYQFKIKFIESRERRISLALMDPVRNFGDNASGSFDATRHSSSNLEDEFCSGISNGSEEA